MRESELLSHIYARSRGLPAPIHIGPGDDAAVLRFDPNGPPLLATVDQLNEGRHYDPESTPLELIARKAVARSVSDIAAMGGTPRCGLATGALRDGFRGADQLFDAMARWANHWGCPLAGGDISFVDGPSVFTVTILGDVHARRGPVLRSGARPGDSVYVSGAVGGSLPSGRHLTFEPRLREAAWLCDALGEDLHALIDLSDGLGRDAGRVAAASGVRIEIDSRSLPLGEGVTDLLDAIGDGEDYELLFATDGDVPPVCEATGVPFRRIGSVQEGSGCVVLDESGEPIDAEMLGWDHGDDNA